MLFSVMDAIHQRRSIRAYRPDQLTDGQLQAILEAGLAAPSARNTQPWHFTAVQDQALIGRINEAVRRRLMETAEDDAARRTFSNPDWSVFYHAPTVIFIENMALAAIGLELGSVVLGMPRAAFEGENADEFRKALHFPEGYDFMLALAVGYPAAEKDAHVVQPDRVTIIK